jgi:hypothetical protein
MEGLPPVEDGDVRLQPLNFAPLGTDPIKLKESSSSEPK